MTVQPALTHPWEIPPPEARRIQRQLRGRLRVQPLGRQPQVIGGVDVSIKDEQARAAVVLISYPDLIPFEAVTAEMAVSFPYVPGLLSFREGPVMLAAFRQLPERPDVLIFDAHGLAHPRLMGLATHLGILLDMRTVGCAKSRLCGEYTEPGAQKGSWSPLVDRGKVIGAALRTRGGVKPVFVSIGHRVDLETAVSLVLDCAPRYRLPEPTRWAHQVAGGGSLPSTH